MGVEGFSVQDVLGCGSVRDGSVCYRPGSSSSSFLSRYANGCDGGFEIGVWAYGAERGLIPEKCDQYVAYGDGTRHLEETARVSCTFEANDIKVKGVMCDTANVQGETSFTPLKFRVVVKPVLADGGRLAHFCNCPDEKQRWIGDGQTVNIGTWRSNGIKVEDVSVCERRKRGERKRAR